MVNSSTCQMEVTETAVCTGMLIQAMTEELELDILDLQNYVVPKSFGTHEAWTVGDKIFHY